MATLRCLLAGLLLLGLAADALAKGPKNGTDRSPTPAPTRVSVPPKTSQVTLYDLSAVGPSGTGDALGVRHALDAFGIPYKKTGDVATALSATEMLVVAGRIDDDLEPALLSRLRADLPRWVMAPGRTLWLSFPKDPVLLNNLGLALATESSTRGRWLVDTTHPVARYADAPEEGEVWLGQLAEDPPTYVTTRSYVSSGWASWRVEPLARHEDGTLAVVTSTDVASGGRAVVLGARFQDLLTRMENELNLKHTRGSTNVFEPSTDTVRLWFRAAYELWTARPRLRAPAPLGRRAAVILTHDIDASSAFAPLQSLFLPLETSYGVRSTLMVTTSYRSNGWISAFYASPDNRAILASARDQGFDIQSHSVSHLPDMWDWLPGQRIDDPALYAPEYDVLTGQTTGGAVHPELLISARLLRDDFGLVVRGWRSGHLARPAGFGGLLQQDGYYYDSDNIAGRAGGSFPYLMLQDYAVNGTESNVLELPLAIGDSGIDGVPPDQVAATWLDVVHKNAANGAPTVILVHPTRPEVKYEPFRLFLDRVATDPELWVGSMDAWYAWYRAQGIRSQRN